MKTKKILVLLTSALLVIGLVAGGATMAYLFDQSGQKQNQFTHGTPSVDIDGNSSGTPESSNVVSHGGNTAVKEVKVTNTGDIPLYVRVMLIPGWKETDGQAPAGKLDFGAEPMWKDDPHPGDGRCRAAPERVLGRLRPVRQREPLLLPQKPASRRRLLRRFCWKRWFSRRERKRFGMPSRWRCSPTASRRKAMR